MYNQHRQSQYQRYREARTTLVGNPGTLQALERFLTDEVASLLSAHIGEITRDYNEATFLYPFWQKYPPEDRGRAPKGDQVPWIEVGEHVLGAKLARLLPLRFGVRDPGLPTGPDVRFLLSHERIKELTNGMTDAAWLMADIKSVGPRDDADHTVMSHNQISGLGEWDQCDDGISNRVMTAVGLRASHPFHSALPPLYVLSDGTIAPTVLLAIKPVYSMLSIATRGKLQGQPLCRVDIAAIPNGLLLEAGPKYLDTHRGLLFPGKDDKDKNPLKIRARISFERLRAIDAWRVRSLAAPSDPSIADLRPPAGR
jgi:hypothetical protein